MAQRTLSRMYDSYDDASQTVTDLENAGIPHTDISLLGPTSADRTGVTATDAGYGTAAGGPAYGTTGSAGVMGTGAPVEEASSGAGAGATVGTVIGGGAGLLAGLGSLAIPGVGPIIAAGWLVATLTGAGAGAAAGGLLGSLTGAGVPDEEAHTYAEGVRRGGSLVTVRVEDDTRSAEVERILALRSPVDPAARRADYQTSGWTGFDEAAGPYGDTAGAAPLQPGPGRSQIP